MTLSSLPRYDPDRVSATGDRAVVLGGSVAGLVAARVLADAYGTVTVFEKDSLPDDPVPRPGVPQGAQIHALLEAGRATLEDFFPGFGEDLLSAGGLLIDGSTDLQYFDEGDYLADGPRRFPFYSASRPLFEQVIREQVTDRPGVTIRTGCQFVEYLSGDVNTVDGVVVRDGDAGRLEFQADLVVDAMGRTSRTPAWLEEDGYSAPPVDEVPVDVAYSTVVIERPRGDRRVILAPASAPHTRGGAAFPVQGDRWLVNLHGMHGDHPPKDVGEFAEFAATLPAPALADLLEEHAWLSEDVAYYPFPSNKRRHYERLDRLPDGLLVVGDAVASFNPIYGQGMSVATLEALALHHALAAGRADLPTRFFERASDVVDVAWSMAVGADFQFPETTGPQPRGTKLFGWYLSRLFRRAHDDGELRDAFLRVSAMERPPTSLVRPWILRRVLRPGNPLDRLFAESSVETDGEHAATR